MADEGTPPSDMPEDPNAQVPSPDQSVQDLAIETELAESYLTYAMSTIVDRALPDVRDGLKPSQRRILVAMNDLNLSPGRKHAKCAGIVGETMKKYHPHGDSAIYPTLVNMAQDWKTRYLLVDKQGNFGSIDPDPPAAMRYTEARLHRHAVEMLEDLKLDTVDWQANFDETVDEPRFLPAKFPNLLVNGSTGIAVGMASSMPPHNLGEVCDAICATIDNPAIELAELMQMLPGPDFPTGGIVMGRGGIAQAYKTGRGRIYVRAKIEHEQRGGRDLLVVKELPYQVSKNDSVIEKIKQQRRNDKLNDISNVVDESSNRGGMRLVIELKRGSDPAVVENQLYQLTPLQSTYSIINIALVYGRPETLGIKRLIDLFIEHRATVVRRRTQYRLDQAKQEAHRIEGLIYAVCDIDEVIKLIRESRTRDEAIEKLMRRGFRIPEDHPQAPAIPDRLKAASADSPMMLSRTQAEAIGRLQLIQLVGLEIETLVKNYAKLLGQIEGYEAILADEARILGIVRDETAELKDKYADERRTVISNEEIGDVDLGDLTPEEQVVVTISHGGYVKRLPLEQYKVQGRGGKGVIGVKAKDEDFTERMFVSSTHDDLLCFTDSGRVFKIKVYEIPEAPRTARGRAIVNILNLKSDERCVEFMPISDFERYENYLVFATRNGLVKRTSLKDYRNVHSGGLIALNLRDNDSLIGVTWTAGDDHLMLATDAGMAIRFSEQDVRVMGRTASGVKGIDLDGKAEVVSIAKIPRNEDEAFEEADLLTLTLNGYGKRTLTQEYLVQSQDGSTRPQNRGGKGRADIKTTARNGRVVTALLVDSSDDLMLITRGGMIVRTAAGSVSQLGRNTQGVRVISLKGDDHLMAVARVADTSDRDDEVDEPGPIESDESSDSQEDSN